VQLALTAVVIWYVAKHINLTVVAAQIMQLTAKETILIFLLLVVQVVAAAYRVRTALSYLGSNCTLASGIEAVLIGSFFAQTPLSLVGADAARLWVLHRGGATLRDAASGVVLDRIAGFVTLLLLILAIVGPLWVMVPDPAMRIGIVVSLAMTMGGILAFGALRWMPSRLRRLRGFEWLAQVATHAHMVLRERRFAQRLNGLSLITMLINVEIIYILCQALGLRITPLQCLILTPFPLLLSMLPISMSGWGVREGAMIVAFGLVGVASEQSLAVSILFGITLLLASLPGGGVWIWSQWRRPRRSAESVGATESMP
jgi:uncharacterized membrane protein YbhN (UPF0104 family)